MFANSVDPDQTPRSAAPDLCLHCSPSSVVFLNPLRLNIATVTPHLGKRMHV